MKQVLALLVILGGLPAWSAAGLTADEIIQRVDDNQVFTTQSFTATMTITKGKRTLTKNFYGYGKQDGQKSFMEFTNPEDKGVKYLKLEDEMWIYFPDADDVLKISGHMLRQGMMGSDLSYEDMLENESIEERYSAKRLEDQVVGGRPCYVVELTARKPEVTYEKQVIIVDQGWFIPVKIELYARGGRLLKNMTQTNVKKINDRWVPFEIGIQDTRKRNSLTTMKFEKISFDVGVPKRAFTKGYLKR